jgi:hypothetical protein
MILITFTQHDLKSKFFQKTWYSSMKINVDPECFSLFCFTNVLSNTDTYHQLMLTLVCYYCHFKNTGLCSVINSVFVVFGGRVFRQAVGIPIGNKCAPLFNSLNGWCLLFEFFFLLLFFGSESLVDIHWCIMFYNMFRLKTFLISLIENDLHSYWLR